MRFAKILSCRSRFGRAGVRGPETSAHDRSLKRLAKPLLVITFCAAVVALPPVYADFEDHEKLSRQAVEALLERAPKAAVAQITGKNLSNVDLSNTDFKGANLSATVFNGANLTNAKLDNCNLTVAFFERANLAGATLRKATLFSVQLAHGNLRRADLTGARIIGDLKYVDLSQATLTHVDGAADMKNQSMGLMRTNVVNGKVIDADLSDSDFSRADMSFSDFSAAKFRHTKLYHADFSGAVLVGTDFTGANLKEAILTDADLTHANLTNADLTDAKLEGVKGLDTAIIDGAKGISGVQKTP